MDTTFPLATRLVCRMISWWDTFYMFHLKYILIYNSSAFQVSTSISMPVNYVRVYGGWEERLNPNYFQRQAWFRQRSRRMNPVATGKNGEVRRSASEESLLDSSSDPPPAPPRRNKALAHNFDQTPPYPSTKSAALMKPRRIDLSTSSTSTSSSKCVADSDGDHMTVEKDGSSVYAALNYRKDSNAKSAAVPSADNYLLER